MRRGAASRTSAGNGLRQLPRSASTRRRTSRGSRPRPPTTCSSRCRASRSAPRTRERGLGQASENVLINGERITNKSRRRRRSTAAHFCRQRRSDRDRRCREPRHSGAVRPGRQRHPEGASQGRAASSSGTPTFAPISPKPEYDTRIGQLLRTPGPVDYTLSVRERCRVAAAFGGPVDDHRPQPHVIETPRRGLSFANIRVRDFQTKFGTGWSRIVGRQSDARRTRPIGARNIRDRPRLLAGGDRAPDQPAEARPAIMPTSTPITSSRSARAA